MYFAIGYVDAMYQVSAWIIDNTMKMTGAKAFGVVFRIFSFFLKDFF